MFFQVNVTPRVNKSRSSKEEIECSARLILAPFQPQARINLETTLNKDVSATLTLKNPSNRRLSVKVTKFPPKERGIILDSSDISIEPESEGYLHLSWTPKETGTWRDTLQFTDSRIKYDVTVFTICKYTGKGFVKEKSKIHASSLLHRKMANNNIKKQSNNLEINVEEDKENTNKNSNQHDNIRHTPVHITEHTLNDNNHTKIVEKPNGVRNSLDISDIKLTPLRPIISKYNHNSEVAKNVPMVDFVNCASSAPPNILLINSIEKFGTNNTKCDIRRETYTTINPKFCKKINIDGEKDIEEKFDDSLSPLDKKSMKSSNLSDIIDNINVISPVKVADISESEELYPTPNSTFNISGVDSVTNSFKGNSTYEFLPTPPSFDKKSNPQLLTDIFERKKLFTNELPTNTRSSSPVPLEQKRLTITLPYSNLRNDTASVKDVLEANLWAESSQKHNHTVGIRDKCTSLEIVSEENLNISSRTYVKSPTNNKNFNNCKKHVSYKEVFTIEISPPKKFLRRNAIKKVSPINHNKIMKDRTITQNYTLNRKKLQLLSNMKKPSSISMPGVKVAKLSLASLKTKAEQKSPQKSIVKLHDSNDLFGQFRKPDVFTTMITEDPSIIYTYYFDPNVIHHHEIGFMKWLNALLTPPEHLDVDIESAQIDVVKVWESCRNKNIALAQSKEEISARYHTDNRLNALRKAACAMYRKAEVTTALSHASNCIDKGILVVRKDRDLHRDIGLQRQILELFLSYNPLWLRIALEVTYGEIIPLHSNNDLVGLTRFFLARFFSDPFLVQTYSVPNIIGMKLPAFQGHMNKFILNRFFSIIYFLDYAKQNKLIGHDPCLFHKKARFKESKEILLNFSRLVLSGIGDVTKVLRNHSYVVSHKQRYLDEYDYAVKDLCTDLRDGVRLCRVMELITGDKTLTCQCRLPAISRLQKIHNVKIALNALSTAGYQIVGDITSQNISDGHREKTLSLLWQLIYKFQRPRFVKAAITIQKWWRANLWYIRMKNYLYNRKKNAVETIQRSWRCFVARKRLVNLREERSIYIAKLKAAVQIIESRWSMLAERRKFSHLKSAVVRIQKWFRRLKTSQPYLKALQKKRKAAITIQIHWRAQVAMRRDRNNYARFRKAVMIIQNRWKATFCAVATQNEYIKLKSAAIFIQSRWRANRSMKYCLRNYLELKRVTIVCQLQWRNLLLTRKIRTEYLALKKSAVIIQSKFRANRQRLEDRQRYLKIRSSVIVIQRCWSRYRTSKVYVRHLRSYQNATKVIQSWWRMVSARKSYQKQRRSTIIIQSWWKDLIIARGIRSEFNSLKKYAIVIQKNWKMKQTRKQYLQIIAAIKKIQPWYRNCKHTQIVRSDFKKKLRSIQIIQHWWRSLTVDRQYRSAYLALKKATIMIQCQWRAKLVGKLVRKKYLIQKSAATKIQAFWRMVRARIVYLNTLKRCKAAISIQRKWQATISARKVRVEYMQLKHAATIIQRKYRTKKISQSTRAQYLARKRAAIIIQKNWKMMKVRKNYLQLKTSAMILQSHYRARKLSIHHRQNYLKIRNEIVIIQRFYRAKCIAQNVRENYLKLYQATLIIQRTWRAEKNMRETRDRFQRYRHAAILIQSHWRMILVRRKYLKLKQAVFKIQSMWRSLMITKHIRNYFLELRKATIFTQARFLSLRVSKRTRIEYKKICDATIFVQRNWRAKLQQRRYAAEVEKMEKFNSAATKIQATWRGYSLRKSQTENIKQLRERSKKATAAATPFSTVESKLCSAINVLQTFSTVGQLSMCLACIETLTRLSPKGCVSFCELNLVERIYQILEHSNRSRPWMEVCLRATNILITLIKLPATAHYVKSLENTATIARLMNASVKRDTDLFLHLSTLFWLFFIDESFANEIRSNPRTVYLIHTLCTPYLAKNASENLMKGIKNKNHIDDERLPNPKPDYGLKTKKARCFSDVSDAILAITKIFHVTPSIYSGSIAK